MLRSFLAVGIALQAASLACAADKPKECIYIDRDERMLRLALPVVTIDRFGKPTVLRESAKEFAYQRCSASWVKHLVQENEFPVLVDGTNRTLMSVAGDLCATAPTFVIYNAGMLRDLYPAYYRNGEMTPDPMERRVAAALIIRGLRCGPTTPEKMHFVARNPVRIQPDPQGRKARHYQYEDFYRGTVTPSQSLLAVNDNKEQDQAFWLALNRQRTQSELADAARKQRQAIGAALGMFLLGSMLQNSSGQ